MMLSRLLIMPGVAHAVKIIGVDIAEAQRVYGAEMKSNNERTRNTPKHSTCSHKCLMTLKGSIFRVMSSIPALRGPGGGLVVAPAGKALLLGSQFHSKQCREQFVTPLLCFPLSRYNSWAFRTPVLLRLLPDLDTCIWWF